MIERRLPGPSQPTKLIVPEWLIEECQKQGIGAAADGRPELKPVTVTGEKMRVAVQKTAAQGGKR
ncbi:MAG: hypothetical protein ACLQKA_08640 [Bryobacteraceae bacterium]